MIDVKDDIREVITVLPAKLASLFYLSWSPNKLYSMIIKCRFYF